MVTAALTLATVARAEDDARTKQLRLLCAQLSGDFTDPGGAAAFRRCMTQDPLNEIRRDNNIAAAPPDRPNAAPPAGHGRNTRHSQADGVHRFEAAEANLLYAIDKDGKLWRWTVDTKDARMVDQDVAAIQSVDGHAFVQHTDGTLWRMRLDGSERARIDKAVAAFQAINAGLVYVLTTDGTLWRETGDAGKRQEVDHTVASFQAVDASLVFVLAADRQLWRETDTAQSRTQVAKDIAAFQYVAGGDTIYVLTADATLWPNRSTDRSPRSGRRTCTSPMCSAATAGCGRNSAAATRPCWWTTTCWSRWATPPSRSATRRTSTSSAMTTSCGPKRCHRGGDGWGDWRT
jgi:hypothetical protein